MKTSAGPSNGNSVLLSAAFLGVKNLTNSLKYFFTSLVSLSGIHSKAIFKMNGNPEGSALSLKIP
jgi:hypothetical protein